MALRIPALHVGQGTFAGGLTLFPVWVGAPAHQDVVVGDREGVIVAEREGSAVVGELVVHNRRLRAVALLEGDLLEGGWQDRTLVRDVLLSPGERRVVEVCCVEQGRWSGGNAHTGGLRRVAPSVVAASRGAGARRQAEVWERVGRYQQAVAPSATAAIRDHLDAVVMDPRLAELRPIDGQRGVVVGLQGRPVSLEVFDSHETLLRRWDGIVHAAALDARLGSPVRTAGAAARYFAERVQRTVLRREVEGPGRRVASDRPGVSVRGLAADGVWLHLTVLATDHPLLAGAR